jgi:hypothetical protein
MLWASGDLLHDMPVSSSTELMITSCTHPDALVTVQEAEWRQQNSKETTMCFKQQIEAWKAGQVL